MITQSIFFSPGVISCRECRSFEVFLAVFKLSSRHRDLLPALLSLAVELSPLSSAEGALRLQGLVFWGC